MTPAAQSRVLALALARRYPCPDCSATLPSRVECVASRGDGRLQVVVGVCPDAQRRHRSEAHGLVRLAVAS